MTKKRQPSNEGEQSFKAMNMVTLDLMTISDAEFFQAHPYAREYFRPAFPLEVEMLLPNEDDLPYDEFKAHVLKVDDDTFARRILRRQDGTFVLIGFGLSAYPADGVSRMQSGRCDGACCE